jgi:hypothetical protein
LSWATCLRDSLAGGATSAPRQALAVQFARLVNIGGALFGPYQPTPKSVSGTRSTAGAETPRESELVLVEGTVEVRHGMALLKGFAEPVPGRARAGDTAADRRRFPGGREALLPPVSEPPRGGNVQALRKWSGRDVLRRPPGETSMWKPQTKHPNYTPGILELSPRVEPLPAVATTAEAGGRWRLETVSSEDCRGEPGLNHIAGPRPLSVRRPSCPAWGTARAPPGRRMSPTVRRAKRGAAVPHLRRGEALAPLLPRGDGRDAHPWALKTGGVLPGAVEDDVGGLEVAVQHPLLVGVVQGASHNRQGRRQSLSRLRTRGLACVFA